MRASAPQGRRQNAGTAYWIDHFCLTQAEQGEDELSPSPAPLPLPCFYGVSSCTGCCRVPGGTPSPAGLSPVPVPGSAWPPSPALVPAVLGKQQRGASHAILTAGQGAHCPAQLHAPVAFPGQGFCRLKATVWRGKPRNNRNKSC